MFCCEDSPDEDGEDEEDEGNYEREQHGNFEDCEDELVG